VPRIEVVGLDGDDTLWHNEPLFTMTHQRFAALLADLADADKLGERLDAIQQTNLSHYGYGAKAFTLSMIETAIDVVGDDLAAHHVRAILDMGKELLAHPVELFDGVRDALLALAGRRLVLITKGDLFHQESKVAGSGLGELFERIEIVSVKDEATYRKLVHDLGIEPHQFVMVGNSLRSEICPVVAIGASAVHVPYDVEWEHESVPEHELPAAGWWRIDSLRELPAVLVEIES
jgi:putative hydrolase of the HAD superfamily